MILLYLLTLPIVWEDIAEKAYALPSPAAQDPCLLEAVGRSVVGLCCDYGTESQLTEAAADDDCSCLTGPALCRSKYSCIHHDDPCFVFVNLSMSILINFGAFRPAGARHSDPVHTGNVGEVVQGYAEVS